jgi:hypothetical protein
VPAGAIAIRAELHSDLGPAAKRKAMTALANSAGLTGENIVVATAIPDTMSRVMAGSAPPLSYRPPAGPLAALLGAAVALLIVVAVISSITLIRGIRLDRLREVPQ